MQDRRRLGRRQLVYYLRVFDTTTGELLGHLVDLSAGGMMLLSDRPAREGETYRCRMVLPEAVDGRREVRFEARAIWSRGVARGGPYSSGFEFVDLAEDDARLIHRVEEEYGYRMADEESVWSGARYGDEGESDWQQFGESITDEVRLQTHVHYLREYLTGAERVLEIGAGRGRFTGELARLCDRLVVADISRTKLELNERNARALGYADRIEAWVESDVADLAPFGADEFDAVVCYGGPLSYVTDRRERALRELVRVTKPGGRLFLSVMSLWGGLQAHFPDLTRSDPRLVRDIVRSGDIGPEAVAVAKSFYHAYRSGELRAFLEGAGLTVEALSASDCISSTWESLLGSWREDDRRWQLLLEMELQATREPGCLDMGSRIIAVARAP